MIILLLYSNGNIMQPPSYMCHYRKAKNISPQRLFIDEPTTSRSVDMPASKVTFHELVVPDAQTHVHTRKPKPPQCRYLGL